MTPHDLGLLVLLLAPGMLAARACATVNKSIHRKTMTTRIYVCRIEVDEDQLPTDFSDFAEDIETCIRSKEGCSVEGWQVEEA